MRINYIIAKNKINLYVENYKYYFYEYNIYNG